MPKIVFIPGASSSGDEVHIHLLTALVPGSWNKYFAHFQELLLQAGTASYVCPKEQDQDARSLGERAGDCARFILELNQTDTCQGWKKRNIILVGHSMGGLIARGVAANPLVTGCIHSVTTLSTPHKGTPLADVAMQKDDPWILGGIKTVLKFFHLHPDHARYIPELVTERKVGLALAMQDMPDGSEIKYYSVATNMQGDFTSPLWISSRYLADKLKEKGIPEANDGIVPTEFMKYGTFLGEINSSHFSGGCTGFIRFTEGCAKASKLVIPHLQKIFEEVKNAP